MPAGTRRAPTSRHVLRRRAPRRAGPPARDADDDDDDDDDDTETTPSPSRSWRTLPVVHVLVFNPETPDEAIYTTSRRTADVARNDFLVFESLRDATRASVAISDTTPDGSMPVVDAVDPRVVAYMASTCGYGVECVAEGGDFTPPEVVVDETVGGEGDEDDDDDDDDVLLAISTVDLARYLSDGGDLPAPDDDDAADEAAAEAAEKEKELRAARRRAARTMRKALRSPTSKVSALVRAAAAAPTKALLTPTRRVLRAMKTAATVENDDGEMDASWGEEKRMPAAANVVYRALIVVAERRLRGDGGGDGGGGGGDGA